MKPQQKVEDRIQLVSAVAHLMMVDPPRKASRDKWNPKKRVY